VVTDAGDKRGREVALRFEQMRHIFGSLVLREKMNTAVPLAIIAFKDHRGLQQVAPLWKGKPVELAGVYYQGDDKHFIALDLSSAGGWTVVFHEYAHMLLNSNFPRAQLWFDEGFAEYFSTIKITKTEVQVGLPPEYIAPALSGGLMPIDQFFATDRTSKDYNETGNRRSLFYAQSWLMVHYVYDMKKLKETAEYFDLVFNQKVPIPQAIKKAYGMDPKQLDKELYGYLHSRNGVSFTWPLPAGIEDVMYQNKKIKDYEAEALIADIHQHSPDYVEQATGEFERILQKNPEHAGAYRGLGYAYMRKGNMDKAMENFRHAAALGSTDARVYYFVALSLFRKTGTYEQDPEVLVEMDQALDKAVHLDPNYADAYNLRGYVLGNARNYPAAIAAIKNAIRLSPRNEQYQSNLANQYLLAQRYDDAIAMFDHLKNSSDPAIASTAAEQAQTARQWKEKPLLQMGAEDKRRNESPQWQPKGDSSDKEELKAMENEQHGIEAPDTRPVRYVSGKLLSVDCSHEPRAVLSVKDGTKNYKLNVVSVKKVLVMGADEFSCLWKERKISVNYKESAPLQGDVVSVEVY
jgi:Flp pilus assembly protein TadD